MVKVCVYSMCLMSSIASLSRFWQLLPTKHWRKAWERCILPYRCNDIKHAELVSNFDPILLGQRASNTTLISDMHRHLVLCCLLWWLSIPKIDVWHRPAPIKDIDNSLHVLMVVFSFTLLRYFGVCVRCHLNSDTVTIYGMCKLSCPWVSVIPRRSITSSYNPSDNGVNASCA